MPNNGQNRQRDSNGRFSSGEDNKQGWWNKLKAMVRGGVQEANTDTHNIDPTVDAVRELGDALSPVVKVGKAMFKGAAWLFGRKKKQPPPSDQEQRQQTRIEKLLRRIADARARATGAAGQGLNLLGGIGGSLLGGLGSLLMRALIPALGLTAAFNFGQWIGGKIYEFIEPALTPLIEGIAAIPETISKAWQGVVDIASKGIEAVVESFKSVKDGVVNAYESTVQAATDGIENVANEDKGIWNWGKGVYNKAVDKTSQFMESMATPKTSKITNSKESAQNQLMVNDAFIKAGFSPEQAKALTAEVGRENDYNNKFLYGKHGDAANGAVNQGFFSWQGERKQRLVDFMRTKGLLNQDGTFKQGQDALNAQAEFTKQEIDSGQFKTVQAAFANPNAKAEDLAKPLGKGYVKWAYGQNVLSNGTPFDWQSHDNKRRGHLANLEQQLGQRTVPQTAIPQSTPMVDSFMATPLRLATTKTALSQTVMPKPVPTMAAKTVPEVPKVQQQVSTVKPKTSGSNAGQEHISQNISDRLLAHAVTGGLGMDRAI